MRTYSVSAVKLWQRCQLAWKYRYVRRIESDSKSPAIQRGTTLHEGLELYHTLDPAFPQWLLEADPEDAELIVRYADKWAYDDVEWEVLAAEEPIEMMVGSHKFVFIPDLVVKIGDDIWVVDHKTTKNIPDEWDPHNMTDLQHLVYIAGMQEIYGDQVRGFMFNYLRTKAPTQPSLIKDGSRIANLRALDTDYNTLDEYCDRLGIAKTGDVADKLNILKHAPDRFFQRHFILVSQAAVDQALKDLSATLQDMSDKEHGRSTSTYPRTVMNKGAGYQSCNSCEFQAICHTELMGIEADLEVLGYVERPEREK